MSLAEKSTDSVSVTIRIAEPKDANELSAMNYEFNDVEVSSEYVREALHSNQEIVAIASIDNTIAGFACAQFYSSFCYDSPWGEITEMYVRPPYRRQGVGSALLAFLEEALARRGISSIKILTGQDNAVARSLYTGIGYIEEDEIVLTKDL